MKAQEALAVTLAPLGEPRHAMAWVSERGIRGVQLSAVQFAGREGMDGSARRDLRATLRRLELACSGIDAWIPPAEWLQSDRVDRVVAACVRAIDLAGALDRVPVCLTVPGASSVPAEEACRREALAAVVHAAELHGVALADAAFSMAGGALPLPPVGACIDPAAILATGRPVRGVVAAAAGHIASARLCDLLRSGMRGPVGQPDGQLDVLEYRVTLDAVGFGGLPVIDARQWSAPRPGVELSLAAWRAALPQGA